MTTDRITLISLNDPLLDELVKTVCKIDIAQSIWQKRDYREYTEAQKAFEHHLEKYKFEELPMLVGKYFNNKFDDAILIIRLREGF